MNGFAPIPALSRRPAAWWLLLAALLLSGLACRGIMDAVSETPALTFSPAALPMARVGQPYITEITIADNVTPVLRVSLAAGDLPPGLTLYHEASDDSAVIEGIPVVAGRYAFTLEAECYALDRAGQQGRFEYVINVLTPEQTLIRAGTQYRHQELEIGVGNIWEEQYVDEAGAEQTGLTTGVWINAPEQPEHFQRAHPGQEIAFGDYRILVVEVGRDADGDYAVVEVSRTEE